uniref:Uncharacterized protein n=1 Tax=Rhizophora mucronata TaxID=61149 RepID=A0A2P2M4W5_RHIMU
MVRFCFSFRLLFEFESFSLCLDPSSTPSASEFPPRFPSKFPETFKSPPASVLEVASVPSSKEGAKTLSLFNFPPSPPPPDLTSSSFFSFPTFPEEFPLRLRLSRLESIKSFPTTLPPSSLLNPEPEDLLNCFPPTLD